ncbi:MAG: copper transporter [Archangiaceae bacterium]|nr:copper transporter [Archangiaceae bacterium]
MRTFIALIAVITITACKKDEAKAPEPVKAVEAPKAVEVKPAVADAKPAAGARVVELKVTEDGFVPGNVTLKNNEPVKFIVTRTTDATCATELLISGTDIKAELPLNKPVEIAWTPTKAGQVKFGCAMDMMVSGMLLVE